MLQNLAEKYFKSKKDIKDVDVDVDDDYYIISDDKLDLFKILEYKGNEKLFKTTVRNITDKIENNIRYLQEVLGNFSYFLMNDKAKNEDPKIKTWDLNDKAKNLAKILDLIKKINISLTDEKKGIRRYKDKSVEVNNLFLEFFPLEENKIPLMDKINEFIIYYKKKFDKFLAIVKDALSKYEKFKTLINDHEKKANTYFEQEEKTDITINKEKIQELKSNKSEIERDIKRYIEKLEKIKSENDNNDKILVSTIDKIKENENKLETKNQEKKIKDDNIVILETKNKEIDTSITTSGTNKELEEKKDNNIKMINDLKKELSALSKEILDLTEEIKNLKGRKSRYDENENKYSKEIEDIQEKINESNRNIKNINNEIDRNRNYSKKGGDGKKLPKQINKEIEDLLNKNNTPFKENDDNISFEDMKNNIKKQFDNIKKDYRKLKVSTYIPNSVHKDMILEKFINKKGDTLFEQILNNYQQDVKEKNLDIAKANFYESVENNNLDPIEELEITFIDKLIFAFLIIFLRYAGLYMTYRFIDNKYVKSIKEAIIYYSLSYVAVLFAFLVIVNIDLFRLRIIFNYCNLHINSSGILSHMIIKIIIGYVIYLLIINLDNEPVPTYLSKNQIIKLKKKIDILSMIVIIFLLIFVLII
jgi:hypothetical protein